MTPSIKRIMVDIETVDTRPSAAIASIGAIEFDPSYGTGREFYRELELKHQEEYGRTVGLDTLVWWSQQSSEARRVFLPATAGGLPKYSLHSALSDFSGFVGDVGRGQKVEMWAYGPDFDCVILGSAYESTRLERPWSYSMNRCHRTLINFAKGLVEVPARVGTHHNALDDARYQAICANIGLKRLGIA